MSFGWWVTATAAECSGCGGTDETVMAPTRRCLRCEGVILLLGPLVPALSPSVVAVSVCPERVSSR